MGRPQGNKKGKETSFGRAKPNNSNSNNTKKAPAKKDVPKEEPAPPPPRVDDETRKQQQGLINIFRNTFSDILSSSSFASTLQSVKQALFDRDFARAFGTEEYLQVYAARYSPTRAVCYASILAGISDHLEPVSCAAPQLPTPAPDSDPEAGPTSPPRTLRVLSVGGGAAEVVAFGAYLAQLPPSPAVHGAVTLLDSAAWGLIVASLTTSLTSTPPPPKNATTSTTQPTDAPLVDPKLFSSAFSQQDVLALDDKTFPPLLGDTPLLITLLFTLNELFTTAGIGKTTKFLLNLTSVVPIGSLLLVVDSPGSYSETTLGKEAKRYPMQWLLDRIILGTQREPIAGRKWTKLESQDSTWFRLADSLSFPIPLENMRYQMHLYRAEDAE